MRVVPLHSICRPKQWKTIPKKSLLDSGVPVYGANGVIGFTDGYTHDEPVLMIGCRGSCGQVHRTEGKAWVNGNAMALDSLRDDVDMRFLQYQLQWRGFEDVISGSSQPQITGQGLKKVSVYMPPLEEQKRIAGILDEADRVRKKTQALIDKYDELAQSLFLDMFGDPVTNPKGWEKCELGDKLTAKGGKRLPKGASYSEEPTVFPYLRVVDLRRNAVDKTNLKFLRKKDQAKIARYTISRDDVFISIAGTIGVCGWIPDDLDGCNLTENAAKIVGLQQAGLRREFLSFYLNSNFIQQQISSRTMAVGVPKLALFRIESLPLFLPPLSIQDDFLGRLSLIHSNKDGLGESAENQIELFSSLLQKAFKGELA